MDKKRAKVARKGKREKTVKVESVTIVENDLGPPEG